ncbi:MAG: phosphoglucosamine mutase [Deltaproteobacteria bacterium]|nr:MAG: phosphoglucosamine mutase [Deltaproteobacteria bacterium]
MDRLFGTDGVRGLANTHPITVEMAVRIGRATAAWCMGAGDKKKTTLVIGRDTRISGSMLSAAVAAGVCAAGADVLDAGILPTPGVAFLAKDLVAGAGIVISASHNPYADNGIKLIRGDGFKLSDEEEAEIEQRVRDDAFQTGPGPAAVGQVRRLETAEDRYLEFLKTTVPEGISLSGMKLVVDCSQGAAFHVGPRLFRELGASVITLFDTPDGVNINADCGSQHTAPLAAAVTAHAADLGIAFDGDADRLIAVDETGKTLTGDQFIAICARFLQAEQRLDKNVVVTTVMSNLGLSMAFSKMGIRHLKADVGDRYVLSEMRASGAVIGGENSGHMIFLNHHTTGDGLLSALQLLQVITASGKRLSELATVMPVCPQVLKNIEVKEKPPIETIPELMAAIAASEQRMDGKGRVFIRYSGTQPLCRVMVEGPDQAVTQAECDALCQVVSAVLA